MGVDEGKGVLYGALAKAQGTYKKLIPNEDSANGMFANLDAIKDATRDSLAQNGLAFYQYIELLEEGTGAALLKTILGHESGQEICSTARVYSGTTDRQTGRTYEIHKRLHALMILGIAPSLNDPEASDDNGDEQEEDHIVKTIINPNKFAKKKGPKEVIDKSQYDQLMIVLDGEQLLTQQIQESYGITTLQDLPRKEFQYALAQINRVKKNRSLATGGY